MLLKKIKNLLFIIISFSFLLSGFNNINKFILNNNFHFKYFPLFGKIIYAQSVFEYFTEDQLLMYILYADYAQLKQMAEYYNIDTNLKIGDLRNELLKYFNLQIKEVKTGGKQLLIVKSADIILMNNIKIINANVVELYGNIYIVIDKRIFKADHIIYNVKNNHIFAEGNVIFIDKNNTYYADKVDFNLNLLKGVFTGVRGKIDNYYIFTKKLYVLSRNSFYSRFTSFSTCDLINPHYHVESNTIYYSPDYILALNNTIYVGNSRVFWFPIYFSLERGAGFSGNFGMEYKKREGFKFYNTWHIKKDVFSFDYYERLGFYSIFNINSLKNIKGNFVLGLGNFLFYDASQDLWTPISPFDGKKYWNLRYGGNLKYVNSKLFDFLSINLNLEYYSDTYLYYDIFKNRRLEKFEIQRFLKTFYPDIFPSSKDYLNESTQINFKIFNTNINILSYLKFSSYINNSSYIYTPDYKKYYLYSISPFNFSSGMDVLNIKNSFISLNNKFQISSSYDLQYKYNNSIENVFFNSILDYTNFRFTFTVPFNLSFGNSLFKFNTSFNPIFNYVSNYEIENDNIDTSSSRFNFILYNSFYLNMRFLNFKVSLSNNYNQYLFKETDFNWTSSMLSVSINGLLLSNILNYSILTGINLLNSSEKSLFYYDQNKLTDLIFNFIFKPFNFFYMNYSTAFMISKISFSNIKTFNDIISYKRYDALKISIASDYFYLWNIKAKINNSVSYYSDFTTNFNKYLINNFSLSFLLEDQFSLSIIILSENRNLWVYESFQQMFFDLLKSYNFFNISDRISSYFNLKSITIMFRRNLHKFTLFASIRGGFILIDNSYNFKITYSFGISSLDFNDLEYKEQIEQIY